MFFSPNARPAPSDHKCDPAELGLLRSRLEAEGIPTHIRNEQVSQVIPTTAFAAELCVLQDEDYPRALELYETWRQTSSENQQPWTCPKCGEKLEGQFAAGWKCGTARDAVTSA